MPGLPVRPFERWAFFSTLPRRSGAARPAMAGERFGLRFISAALLRMSEMPS